jgi:hypothetical protein
MKSEIKYFALCRHSWSTGSRRTSNRSRFLVLVDQLPYCFAVWYKRFGKYFLKFLFVLLCGFISTAKLELHYK